MNILDIEWNPVDSNSSSTRIGGAPLGFETGKRLWPFYTIGDETLPLLFLGQLLLPDDRMLELFSDVDCTDSPNDYWMSYSFEPTGNASVAHLEGEPWPDWVSMREVSENDMSIVSGSAVAPEHFPDDPIWFTEDENIPGETPFFLFQVPEHPGGLDIKDNIYSYVYWDQSNKVVLFSEIYC